MKKQKFPIGNIVLFLFVLVLFVGLFYMSSFFREREENVRAENPIVFCQPLNVPEKEKECFFTTHIHYVLEINAFGKPQTLGFEAGPLDSFHTHSEKNKLHWHALLPADPQTRQPQQLPTVQGLLEAVEVLLQQKNPSTGELTTADVFVDGKKIENLQEYTLDLKKEQTITVIFT